VREGNITSRFMLRGRGGLMVKIAHAATTTCTVEEPEVFPKPRRSSSRKNIYLADYNFFFDI
jgi:hypothetical protein